MPKEAVRKALGGAQGPIEGLRNVNGQWHFDARYPRRPERTRRKSRCGTADVGEFQTVVVVPEYWRYPSMVHLFGGASDKVLRGRVNSIETTLCNEAVASAEEVVRQNWEELEAQAEWAHDPRQQANQLYRSEGVPSILESKMAVPFSVIDEVAGGGPSAKAPRKRCEALHWRRASRTSRSRSST